MSMPSTEKRHLVQVPSKRRMPLQNKIRRNRKSVPPDYEWSNIHFFTFWQKFIRIVATCWRVALPCGSR